MNLKPGSFHTIPKATGIAVLGLSLFFILTLGLGMILPMVRIGHRVSIGALWLGGYAVLTGAIFFAHVALQIPFIVVLWSLMAIAVLAALRRLRSGDIHWRTVVAHPCLILVVFAALVILGNGGIGYIPYTIDEFTNWLGASRLIFFSGGYEAMRESMYLSGYTPGWRLLLTVPWFFSGTVDAGQSTAATLVLHVAVAGLFFDAVRGALDDRLKDLHRRNYLIAWGALLLFLSVQATGALWPYTLLVEQPQIYALASIAILMFAAETTPSDRNLCLVIGLALMLAYLVKTAAVLVIPGVGLVYAALLYFRGGGLTKDNIKNIAIIFAPVLMAVFVWTLLKPASDSCFSNPAVTFTAAALERADGYDWADLAHRFASAILGYLATYKWPLSIVAALGLGAAAINKRVAAAIMLASFCVLYFSALYWFHLTCFGPYLFETLASVERFTRVALQPIHAAGLLGLTLFVIYALPKKWVSRALQLKPVTPLICAAVLGLFVWQSILVQRNVEDMTTRRYQNIDPRITDVARASAFVSSQKRYSGTPPLIQFISQGQDADILGYAKYFGITDGNGAPVPLFTTALNVSWSLGEKENPWQTATSLSELVATFKRADIIWPTDTAPWLDDMLRALAAGSPCPTPITDAILIKRDDGGFECRAKP